MLNPSKREEYLNSPTERASQLNDPQFENQQGYFSYDLTHQEFVSPLFGQITPTMHLDTVPADRFVVNDNTKLILNQINGNFLSNVNQYVDSFFVSLRSVFPMNYEKLIPNPVKGMDIPNSALPQVPFRAFIHNMLHSETDVTVKFGSEIDADETLVNAYNIYNHIIENGDISSLNEAEFKYFIPRLLLVSTILSRGQLLDYLGIQFDADVVDIRLSSELQKCIDNFQRDLYEYLVEMGQSIGYNRLSLLKDEINVDAAKARSFIDENGNGNLSKYREIISDIFERGDFPIFYHDYEAAGQLNDSVTALCQVLDRIFTEGVDESADSSYIYDVDESSNPFGDGGYLNIGKVLAYQQVVAQYYTNDHVDNIFSSDLFMQLLRGVMYPTDPDTNSAVPTTTEPVFDYNGVNTEYDYISCGSFYVSLISNIFEGKVNRQWIYSTMMFLLKRSLRYGDYFATARPNMLAVSDQLSINVVNGKVSPIDVTKNLLLQRYLNSCNYVGQGFLQAMSSLYGVRPSDTGTIPRFITHRKISIQNQITNNTANDQGKQTTNLVGYSDSNGFDVFIDDFGYILNLTSFDVLPIYKSGIENTYHLADRFDYFNPMMQNIGDQPIRLSELIGNPSLYEETFGYTMRNSEYKYKISKAHGAFCNSLAGFMLAYPINSYVAGDGISVTIGPEFIRDKASYLDAVVPQMTGVSPAEYYHFIVSCTNQVKCARKIQATPSVLF